ncbi:sugar ABC transporter substrate-binding protein [Anaerolineae bacterium CFX9]|nr:sugar ABC transporter substrate-binding protein [Anaerolineae bacterium CFX9]
MISKRRIAVLLALFIVVLSIVPAVPAQENRTLRVMGWIGLFEQYLPAWEYMVSEFEARNPGVTIDYVATPFEDTLNQATTAILGGNAPDVIQIVSGWSPVLHGLGALAPLDDLLDPAVIEQIPAAMLESATFDDALRGIPWVPGPIVLVYNRTLLTEAGVDPDAPIETWADLQAAIDAVCALPARADGSPVYGLAMRTARNPNSGHWLLPVIWGFGGELINEDGEVVLNSPESAAALQWIQEEVASGCIPNGFNINETRNTFAQGRAAFIFEGPWARGNVLTLSDGAVTVAEDGDVWVSLMPAGPDGNIRQIANNHMLVVTEQSQNKDLAAEFIEFVTNDPQAVTQYFEVSAQLSTANMEVLRSGAFAEDEYTQIFVEALNYSNGVPVKNAQWDAIADALSLALQEVMNGSDPAASLENASRVISDLLLYD